MAEAPQAHLGVKADGTPAHSIAVYPQKWAAIVNRLGRLMTRVMGSADTFAFDPDDPDLSAIVEMLGGNVYQALCVFIPNLPDRMPEYKFAGYGSQDAYDAGDYDEREDESPTFPQLLDVFEIVIEVNGGKRFRDMLGKEGWSRLKKAAQELREPPSGSPSSHGANGTSLPTSSGTTDPIAAAPGSSEQLEKSAASSGIPLNV